MINIESKNYSDIQVITYATHIEPDASADDEQEKKYTNSYIPNNHAWYNTLFSSAAGLKSIETLGLDGFIAAFLISLDWDLFENHVHDYKQNERDSALVLNLFLHNDKLFVKCYNEIPKEMFESVYFKQYLCEALQKRLFSSFTITKKSGDIITTHFNSNDEVIGIDTQKYIFGKLVTKQQIKGNVKEVYLFDRDLNVIGSNLSKNEA